MSETRNIIERAVANRTMLDAIGCNRTREAEIAAFLEVFEPQMSIERKEMIIHAAKKERPSQAEEG